MPLEPCTDNAAFAELLAHSQTEPVLLFKHSTRCPISAAAHREVTRFTEAHPEIPCRIVLVVEQRPLSLHIAEVTGVTHQSPQALLLVNGAVAWHASHYDITAPRLWEALAPYRT
jgi:bacillithiol system protein YtxJ